MLAGARMARVALQPSITGICMSIRDEVEGALADGPGPSWLLTVVSMTRPLWHRSPEHHFPVDGVVFHQQGSGGEGKPKACWFPCSDGVRKERPSLPLNSLAVNQKQLPGLPGSGW